MRDTGSVTRRRLVLVLIAAGGLALAARLWLGRAREDHRKTFGTVSEYQLDSTVIAVEWWVVAVAVGLVVLAAVLNRRRRRRRSAG